MESKSKPLLPTLVVVAVLTVALALGWWSYRENHLGAGNGAGEQSHAGPHVPALPAPAAVPEDLEQRVAKVVEAARIMLQPDAATHSFFENLSAAEATKVFDLIDRTPASNEHDLLLLMAARRWAQHDGATALERVIQIEKLPLRASALDAVFEAWGTQDAQAAFARAQSETDENRRARAFSALLTGAAATNPGVAITLWEGTPELFRSSPAGGNALDHIVEAAGGTGKREFMQTIVLGLPPGEERVHLTAAVARNWGQHDPEAAVAWLRSVTLTGDVRDGMIDGVFSAYVRMDPVRAAEWAVRQDDERRRSNYVAAAIAAWAPLDTAGAETWVNEQPEGGYLDGATYAMAAYYIERRNLPQAFAWTRRLNRPEARADLLGNLGWVWNKEQPDAFKKFMAVTSLNRAEVEMLQSKIINVPSP